MLGGQAQAGRTWASSSVPRFIFSGLRTENRTSIRPQTQRRRTQIREPVDNLRFSGRYGPAVDGASWRSHWQAVACPNKAGHTLVQTGLPTALLKACPTARAEVCRNWMDRGFGVRRRRWRTDAVPPGSLSFGAVRVSRLARFTYAGRRRHSGFAGTGSGEYPLVE